MNCPNSLWSATAARPEFEHDWIFKSRLKVPQGGFCRVEVVLRYFEGAQSTADAGFYPANRSLLSNTLKILQARSIFGICVRIECCAVSRSFVGRDTSKMMKNTMLNALVFGCSLVVCSCTQAAGKIKVEVLRGAETVAAVDLPEGQVKAAAKNFKYNTSTGTWTLTNGCAITIIQDAEHSLRFEGESAKVTAENIERQISSSSPIDYPNTPIVDLSEALKQDSKGTLFRLTWFYSMGSYSSSGTALYDRENHSIKENIYVSDGASGYGSGFYRRVYAKVDDETIHKAAKEEGMKGSGPFNFELLTQLGATRQERNEP